jgi:hypothetical protein
MSAHRHTRSLYKTVAREVVAAFEAHIHKKVATPEHGIRDMEDCFQKAARAVESLSDGPPLFHDEVTQLHDPYYADRERISGCDAIVDGLLEAAAYTLLAKRLLAIRERQYDDQGAA